MSNTNYTNFSKAETKTEVKPVRVEEVQNGEVEVVAEPEVKGCVIGVVNCNLLNVRKEPSFDAKVAMVIRKGVEVCVDEKASTEDFYCVTTESGIEGFCKKEFIDIKP